MNALQLPGVRNTNVTIQEILCDDNGSFIRRYIYANNLMIASVDVGFDGTTYIVSGNVVNCQENNRNFEVLCDDNGSFIRHYTYDGDTLVSISDIDFDGNAYVAVGLIGACNNVTHTIKVLCDDLGTFIRTYELVGNTIVGFIDRDVDGNPYVPAGLIIDCAALETKPEILCDDNGQFIRRYYYYNGALISFDDIDISGNNYVPVGTVVNCISSIGTYRETLCDQDGYFVRSYIYGDDGSLIGITDQDLLGNPYVPVGIVRRCTDVMNYTVEMCGYNSVGDQFVPFFRRYTFSGLAVATFADYEPDGNTFNAIGLTNLTFGSCSSVDFEESVVCTDQGSAIKRTIKLGGTYLDTFFGQDGVQFTPTQWIAGGCDTFGELDMPMCAFDTGLATFVSFVRRYQFDSIGGIINVIDYDTSGNVITVAITPIYYGHCEQFKIIKEPFCFYDINTGTRTNHIRNRMQVPFQPIAEYWEDQEGNVIPTPPNYDNYQLGECPIVNVNCEITIAARGYCDPGNADESYVIFNIIYENNAFPQQEFILDDNLLPYVPVVPDTLCAGSDGTYQPTTGVTLLTLLTLYQNYMHQEFRDQCPAFIATFAKMKILYPSFEILDRLPHRTVSYTESLVCIEFGNDTLPAIMRTEESEYRETFSRTFYIDDGIPVTPISWTPGPCPNLIENCELTIMPQFFCDTGNFDQEYYVFTFVYGMPQFPSLQITVDASFNPYVPVTPGQLCAGSDGSLPGTLTEQLAAAQLLAQTYGEADFFTMCPVVNIKFGKFAFDYPSNQITEFFPNLIVTTTETIVCADGMSMFKRTTTSGNGTEFTEFLTIDGANYTPAVWIPGECKKNECTIQLLVTSFCDQGNGNQRYFNVLFNSPDLPNAGNIYDVTINGAIYVPVGPSVNCNPPYSNLLFENVEEVGLFASSFAQNILDADYLNRCPNGKFIINGMYEAIYPLGVVTKKLQHIVTTHGEMVNNTTLVVNSLQTLRSITIVVVSGTVDVTNNGTILSLPIGASVSWSVDSQDEFLFDDFTIDSTGGANAIVTYTRG